VIRAGDVAEPPGIAIFGKLSNSDQNLLAAQIRANLELAASLKTAGTSIVTDFCDNHFADPLRGDYARALLGFADLVVVNTQKMREMVAAQTAKPLQVIPDPIEGPGGPPRFEVPRPPRQGLLGRLSGRQGIPAKPLELLWFGHQSGLAALHRLAPELESVARTVPLSLEIVCAPGFGGEELAAALEVRGQLKARFTPWSIEETWSALQRCDLVVLPAVPGDPLVATKSANRLTETIWAGRYALAHPVPAYEAFADCAWVSEDLATGLRWALRNPELVTQQIANGRQMIREQLLPASVALQWENALRAATATSSTPAPAAAPSGAAFRLNLGCGDKILPGYVNVDVVPSRNGTRPDVLCDLRKLSAFATGVADEILSVHVVEHFWRWEVEAILAEWVRVLKPGGRLVIECPNLAAACEALLADPDVGPGPEGNRSMWVLYGDPAWRDPLMCHCWGYTPQTLARLLHGTGLVDVRQEPAQFKMREPRDMRVAGVKPQS
jgi:hypothetical protein